MPYFALPCQADRGATSVVQDETGAIIARCENQIFAVAIETALNAQQQLAANPPCIADEIQIDEARLEYASDEIRIDDDAEVSEGEEGYWVQAWVFLTYPDDASGGA